MAKKIVAMPLIPGGIGFRSGLDRSDLRYTKYGQATWKWWCEQHGIEFVAFDQPLGGAEYGHMPYTIKRWFIPELLIRKHGSDTRIAIVDADTMIRWDTPDFLEESKGFAAVPGRATNWIVQSIRAFQQFFPGVSVPWWEYFNAGVVVLGERQLHAVRAFLEFASRHWPELIAVIRSGTVGTDQTLLNFVLRRENERVHLLPPPFNLQQCFPMDPFLRAIDRNPRTDPALFAQKAFSRPEAFDFLELGYVWHFSGVSRLRWMVMGEAWRRVRNNYPGISLDE